MGTGFEGNPHFRWGLWEIKKKAQVLIRTELSLYLSISLLCLVLWRERDDLGKTFHKLDYLEWAVLVAITVFVGAWIRYLWLAVMRRRLAVLTHIAYWVGFGGCIFFMRSSLGDVLKQDIHKISLLDWTIIVVTLGTIVAAGWELFGPKLASSPQEIGFAITIRGLLKKLDDFCYGASPGSDFDAFLTQFLAATGITLCGGKKPMEADCMLREGDVLYVLKSSANMADRADLRIPLPSSGKPTGPAGFAFEKLLLVYLPDIDRDESWSFTSKQDDSYNASAAPNLGWVKGKKENFKSVLSIPLKIYDDQGVIKKVGVLNYSNERLDPFVNRDLLMAECFAKILEQALTFKQKRDQNAKSAS